MDDIFYYVINLADRKDRRAEMDRQLARVGWQAQFSNSHRPAHSHGFPSIGAYGCFMSHLATLRRGATMRGHILLMEDDLSFVPGFRSLWEPAIAQLEACDWSIFYPGHTQPDGPAGLQPVEATVGLQCTHFMLINKSAVTPLIKGLEAILGRPPGHPEGGPQHVDGAYSTIRAQNPRLTTYTHSPALGYQRSSASDIAVPAFYDRGALRPLVRQLRRVKQYFR